MFGTWLHNRMFCVTSLMVCVSADPIVRPPCTIVCDGSIVYGNAAPCSGRTESLFQLTLEFFPRWCLGFGEASRRCALRAYLS